MMSGASVEEMQSDSSLVARRRILIHAGSFVLGFTAIFMMLGLSASALGSLFYENKSIIAQVGGVIIIFLGLNMTGVIRVPFLMMDKRPRFLDANRSPLSSLVTGVAFSAGWTPCIGPILSGILVLASQTAPAWGLALLFVYSMGLAVPFLLAAVLITRALDLMKRIKRYLPVIEITSGAVLVATGALLVTGTLSRLSAFFSQTFNVS